MGSHTFSTGVIHQCFSHGQSAGIGCAEGSQRRRMRPHVSALVQRRARCLAASTTRAGSVSDDDVYRMDDAGDVPQDRQQDVDGEVLGLRNWGARQQRRRACEQGARGSALAGFGVLFAAWRQRRAASMIGGQGSCVGRCGAASREGHDQSRQDHLTHE